MRVLGEAGLKILPAVVPIGVIIMYHRIGSTCVPQVLNSPGLNHLFDEFACAVGALYAKQCPMKVLVCQVIKIVVKILHFDKF